MMITALEQGQPASGATILANNLNFNYTKRKLLSTLTKLNVSFYY